MARTHHEGTPKAPGGTVLWVALFLIAIGSYAIAPKVDSAAVTAAVKWSAMLLLPAATLLATLVQATRAGGPHRSKWAQSALLLAAAIAGMAFFGERVAGLMTMIVLTTVSMSVLMLGLTPAMRDSLRSASALQLLWPFPVSLAALWPQLGTVSAASWDFSAARYIAPVLIAVAATAIIGGLPADRRQRNRGTNRIVVGCVGLSLTSLYAWQQLSATQTLDRSLAVFVLCSASFATIGAGVHDYGMTGYAQPKGGGVTLASVVPIGFAGIGVARLASARSIDEVLFLMGCVLLIISLTRTLNERRSLVTELSYRASHDELTGLANRAQLLDDMRSASGMAWIMYLDLDEFKTVNDRFGHPVGDQILTRVASRLRQALPHTSTVSRIGGDEFVILFYGDRREAMLAARQLQKRVSEQMIVGSRRFLVTTSIGIALHTSDADASITEADLALREAKSAKTTSIRFFDQELRDAASETARLRDEFPAALRNGRLHLEYQPVVDITTGHWVGAEALLRWERSDGSRVSPLVTVALANDLGLAAELGHWVRHTAALALPRLKALAPGDSLWCSVNVSATDALDPGFGESLKDIAQLGVSNDMILELTEDAWPDDLTVLRDHLQHARSLGHRVALDDFGSGYSSLGRLSQIGFDVVKLDRSFVTHLEFSAHLVRIVQQVMTEMGSLVIVEGVETAEQRDRVSALSCTLGQGYFWARPRRLEELEAARQIRSEQTVLTIA